MSYIPYEVCTIWSLKTHPVPCNSNQNEILVVKVKSNSLRTNITNVNNNHEQRVRNVPLRLTSNVHTKTYSSSLNFFFIFFIIFSHHTSHVKFGSVTHSKMFRYCFVLAVYRWMILLVVSRGIWVTFSHCKLVSKTEEGWSDMWEWIINVTVVLT